MIYGFRKALQILQDFKSNLLKDSKLHPQVKAQRLASFVSVEQLLQEEYHAALCRDVPLFTADELENEQQALTHPRPPNTLIH